MQKNTSGYTFHKDTPLQAVTGYFESNTLLQDGKRLLVFETKLLQGVMPFGPQAGVITENDLTPGVVEYLLNKKDENGKAIYAPFLVKIGSEKATSVKAPKAVTVEDEDATTHVADEEAVISASEAGGAKASKASTSKGSKKKPPVKKLPGKVAEEEDFN